MYRQETLQQIQELYRRLTPEEIAELRGSPLEIGEELQRLRQIAASRALARGGSIQTPLKTTM